MRMMKLGLLAALILTVNLPFGFWREGTRKLSPAWFVAVHAPVPLVVGLRFLFGVAWQLKILPILVGAFAAGQFVGGRARRRWAHRRETAN